MASLPCLALHRCAICPVCSDGRVLNAVPKELFDGEFYEYWMDTGLSQPSHSFVGASFRGVE